MMRELLHEPTSFVTPEDAAWLAGFFEGEGCVSRKNASGQGHYSLIFTQVNPEPMAKVHSLCGGTVTLKRRGGRYDKPHWKECLILQLHGDRARRAGTIMHPYLSSKRRKELAPLLAFERQAHWNSRKTHCKNGHEFTPENTYHFPISVSYPRGRRACRTCIRARGRVHAV